MLTAARATGEMIFTLFFCFREKFSTRKRNSLFLLLSLSFSLSTLNSRQTSYRRVRIWDLATGELVRSLPAGMNVAGRAAARASREEEEEDDDGGGDDRGRAAAAAATSAGNDGFGQLDPVRDVSWHPSGTALAAASFDGSITVFGPRGCRRRRGGSGGRGGSGSIFFGGGAENPRRRVTMLPIQDDEDDGDGDDDYEPW